MAKKLLLALVFTITLGYGFSFGGGGGNQDAKFSCSQDAYLFTGHDYTNLYSIDLGTGEYETKKSHLSNGYLNATGYNVKDNLIWGYDISSHKIFKLDANNKITLYKVDKIPDANYYAGDVSQDGIMFINSPSQNRLYKIKIHLGIPTYAGYTDIKSRKDFAFGDFAFNPVDGYLYAFNTNEDDKSLYRIDSKTGNITDLGSVGVDTHAIALHTVIFDKKGNIYFYGKTGTIYTIDLSKQKDYYKAKVFTRTKLRKLGGDGARCPNAEPPEKPDNHGTCEEVFLGAVSTTEDEIILRNNAIIYNQDNSLVTKNLSQSQNAGCEKARGECKFTHNNAKEYDFSVDVGSGEDGSIELKSVSKKTIDTSSQYSEVIAKANSELYLKGNITIHVKNSFKLKHNNKMYVSGHVVIECDTFEASENAHIFMQNGSLTIKAYNISFKGNSKTQNDKNTKIILLSKNDVYFSNNSDIKGVLYADGEVSLSGNSRIVGAVTSKTVNMTANAKVTFDEGIVSSFCSPPPPSPQECKYSFPSVLSSTKDSITATGAVAIYNNDQPLVTKKLAVASALCDNKICRKTDTLANTYDFTVEKGSGKDGSGFGRGTITSDKEYTSVTSMMPMSVSIEGNVTIKIQGELRAMGMATFNIKGNVVIYADKINCEGMTNFNISKNSSLTIIANSMVFSGEIGGTSDNDQKNSPVILLSKEDITFGGMGLTKVLAYSDKTVNIAGTLTLQGAVTAKKTLLGAGAILKYREDYVDSFCKVEKNQISITSSPQVQEGDSGRTKMYFNISLDKALDKDVVVTYSTQDRSAKADEDYIPQINKTITIPAGQTTANIVVDIVTDTVKESDEDFYLNLISATNATINSENSTAIGTILNDDSLRFEVIDDDNNSSISTPTIKTKIVSNIIKLKVVSLDGNSNPIKPSAKNIKVALFNKQEQITQWKSVDFKGASSTTVVFIKSDFTWKKLPKTYDYTYQAFADVRVKVSYTDLFSGQTVDTSTDNFAIRPDRYILTLPSQSTFEADKQFSLRVHAVDINQDLVKNYNSVLDTSFKITPKEKKAGCYTGSLVLQTKKFNGGIFLDNTASYTNIGSVDISVYEIKGSEFAKVDAKDTSDAQRLITSDKKTINLSPSDFQITSSLTDYTSNFTFYADATETPNMGAKYTTTITAVSDKNNTVTNFKKGCYSVDTTLKTYFKNTNPAKLNNIIIDHNTAKAHGKKKQYFTTTIPKDDYQDGTTTKTIMINLGRSNTAVKEPSLLTINKLKISANFAKTYTLTGNNQAHFYYARAHAPSPQTSTQQNFDANIYYEVYCKNCNKNTFVQAKNKASVDEIYWYILPSGLINGICDYNNPRAMGANTNTGYKNKDKLTITTPEAPYKDKIFYTPSHGYLRYNRFGTALPEHFFDIKVTASNNQWAGEGTQGTTVDTNISKINNQSLEW